MSYGMFHQPSRASVRIKRANDLYWHAMQTFYKQDTQQFSATYHRRLKSVQRADRIRSKVRYEENKA